MRNSTRKASGPCSPCAPRSKDSGAASRRRRTDTSTWAITSALWRSLGAGCRRAEPMPVRKILIVDDSPTNRHALTEMLRKHGYQCSIAETGKEAIERAKSEKPDMILMDVVMPDMDGY